MVRRRQPDKVTAGRTHVASGAPNPYRDRLGHQGYDFALTRRELVERAVLALPANHSLPAVQRVIDVALATARQHQWIA